MSECAEHENLDRFNLLMRQYSESLSTLRHLDSLVWQIPALSMAVNSLLLNQYFNEIQLKNKLIILCTSLVFTFVFSIALQKHRFSSNARHEDFKWYENELIKYFSNSKMRKMTIKTADVYCDKENYSSVNRNWWRRQGAYTWLWSSMKLSLVIIIFLLLSEVGVWSLLLNDC